MKIFAPHLRRTCALGHQRKGQVIVVNNIYGNGI
jgi:hypothetical protein